MSLIQVSSGKNFVVYKDASGAESILLKNVRFSFPHVGSKHEQTNEDGVRSYSWGATALLDKDTHNEAKEALQGLIKRLLTANKDSDGTVPKIAKDKVCLRDGDADDEGDIPKDYAGNWYVSFKESADRTGVVRPAVRNEFGKLMIDPAKAHDPGYIAQAVEAIDQKFYGGCYGNVLIRPWYFGGKTKGSPKTFPKRVSAGYSGIQFTKDGKPFGKGRIDESTAAWDSSDDNGDDL